MSYSQSQINAVRELQGLLEVQGALSDRACEKYLDWHLSTQTAEARGITSLTEAKTEGLANGLSAHEAQFRKLASLANQEVV